MEALAELKDLTVADAEVRREGETLWVTVESDRLTLKGGSSASLSGGTVRVAGDSLELTATGDAEMKGENLDLKAQVYIRGELLEDMIRRIAAGG